MPTVLSTMPSDLTSMMIANGALDGRCFAVALAEAPLI